MAIILHKNGTFQVLIHIVKMPIIFDNKYIIIISCQDGIIIARKLVYRSLTPSFNMFSI